MAAWAERVAGTLCTNSWGSQSAEGLQTASLLVAAGMSSCADRACEALERVHVASPAPGGTISIHPGLLSATRALECAAEKVEMVAAGAKRRTASAACQLAGFGVGVMARGLELQGSRVPGSLAQAGLVAVAAMDGYWRVRRAAGGARRRVVAQAGVVAVRAVEERYGNGASAVVASLLRSSAHLVQATEVAITLRGPVYARKFCKRLRWQVAFQASCGLAGSASIAELRAQGEALEINHVSPQRRLLWLRVSGKSRAVCAIAASMTRPAINLKLSRRSLVGAFKSPGCVIQGTGK